MIYIVANLSGSGEHRDEKEIAKVAGTTPITLRKRCKELEKRLQSDIHSSYSTDPN
ncbi:MAG: cyclin family protein [Candidatus Methanospirareceae archaeon]